MELLRQCVGVGRSVGVHGDQQIDPGVAGESVHDAQPLGLGERIGPAVFSPAQVLGASGFRREAQHGDAVGDDRIIGLAGPIPFEHGELGMVQRAALAVAPHMTQAGDPLLAGSQQLLHREFGRGVKVASRSHAVVTDHRRGEGVEMGLVAGRALQTRRVDEDEILLCEVGAQGGLDPVPRKEDRPAIGMDRRRPPGGSGRR
jgi:hypothetical protein